MTDTMENSTINCKILNGNYNAQKFIAQANIKFSDLSKYCRFTYMVEAEESVDNITIEDNNRYYQRRVDKNREKEIAKFIKDAILRERKSSMLAAIFPSAMILALEADLDHLEDNNTNISISVNDKSFYIVDGQHRLSGMIYLYDNLDNFRMSDVEKSYVKKYLDNYIFNCSILLNFDLWEQAQIFAEVNFNQKKVSKNLYYSIYGMHFTEEGVDKKKTSIYVAHALVSLLNSEEKSPLYHKIRMLGYGNGLVSQSFVADSLIRDMQSPRGIWYEVLNVDKPRLRPIGVECITFFSAVKGVFVNIWPEENVHKSIILKTTGIGALIRTMVYIHKFLMSETLANMISNVTDGYLCEKYYQLVYQALSYVNKSDSKLFSFNGEYAKTGGSGLENKLYRKIESILDSMPESYQGKKHCQRCGKYFAPSLLSDSGLCPSCEEYYATNPDA